MALKDTSRQASRKLGISNSEIVSSSPSRVDNVKSYFFLEPCSTDIVAPLIHFTNLTSENNNWSLEHFSKGLSLIRFCTCRSCLPNQDLSCKVPVQVENIISNPFNKTPLIVASNYYPFPNHLIGTMQVTRKVTKMLFYLPLGFIGCLFFFFLTFPCFVVVRNSSNIRISENQSPTIIWSKAYITYSLHLHLREAITVVNHSSQMITHQNALTFNFQRSITLHLALGVFQIKI